MLQLPTLQKEVRYFGVLYEFLGAVLFLCIGIRLCRLGFVLGNFEGVSAIFIYLRVFCFCLLWEI